MNNTIIAELLYKLYHSQTKHYQTMTV